MQFCWISARLLIRFHIIIWQSSSITMASETGTYTESTVFLQIGISKLSLIGRHLLLQLSHLEFHRVQYSDLSCSWNTTMTFPQEFPLSTTFCKFADDWLVYRVIPRPEGCRVTTSRPRSSTGMGKRLADGI